MATRTTDTSDTQDTSDVAETIAIELGEIAAYGALAERGDVMLVCMWMTNAAHAGRHDDVTRLVRQVGPRLLRAAAALAALRAGRPADATRAWRDLLAAVHAKPFARTAHAFLSELAIRTNH